MHSAAKIHVHSEHRVNDEPYDVAIIRVLGSDRFNDIRPIELSSGEPFKDNNPMSYVTWDRQAKDGRANHGSLFRMEADVFHAGSAGVSIQLKVARLYNYANICRSIT